MDNTPSVLSEDQILSHYEKMNKEKDCDPILVSGTIFYAPDANGKMHKYVTCALLPIILTAPRYLSFVQSFGGEYRWNEERCTHERIFWCRYKKEYKSLVDMYNANEENIHRVMGKYNNPIMPQPVDPNHKLDDHKIILP